MRGAARLAYCARNRRYVLVVRISGEDARFLARRIKIPFGSLVDRRGFSARFFGVKGYLARAPANKDRVVLAANDWS